MSDGNDIMAELAGLEAAEQGLDEAKRTQDSAVQELKVQKVDVATARRELAGRVCAGETTGDPVLDMQVRLTNSFQRVGSFERGEPYHRLLWLFEEVVTCRGQLVVYRESDYSEIAGIVAEDATLVVSPYSGEPHPMLGIPLAARYQDRHHDIEPGYITIGYHILVEAEINKPPGQKEREYKPQTLFFGEAAVQAWFETLAGDRAIEVWAMARALGRPLVDTPVLTLELHRRQLAGVAELRDKQDSLKQLTRRLSGWQQNPGKALAEHHGKFEPIPGGVTIDFGLGSDVRKALENLRLVVNLAKWLGMEDNDTYKAAVRQINGCPEIPE